MDPRSDPQPENPAKESATLTLKSTPIKPSQPIPKPVLHACSLLHKQGHKAWLAGGCVRDMLIGRTPKDWDVVTNAPAETIKSLFPEHLDVGVVFGVFKLPPQTGKKETLEMDIAIFRKEQGYSDRRHPDVVDIGDEATDVQRRDFTVNALYYDPESHCLLDYVNGQKDLASKTLRSVGPAKIRFSEDALRILRAARLSAQLGFKIEPATAQAMKVCKDLLSDISRERIRDEVMRLLGSDRAIHGIRTLINSGLWEPVFGIKKTSFPSDLGSYKPAPHMTAFHWLCGLGIMGMFGDPTQETDAIVERLTEKLRLTNDEKRTLKRGLSAFADASDAPQTQPLEWVQLAREDKFLIDLLKSFVKRARGPSVEFKDQVVRFLEQVLRWAAKKDSEKTWPTAEQLIKQGLAPGPKLGKALKEQQWDFFWKQRP